MALKGRLGMYAAMAMMMAGATGMAGMPSLESPRPKPRKLTPEEEEKLLQERMNKFISSLEQHNIERKKNFPKFKEFVVFDLTIIAFNSKNAVRDMNILLNSNGLSLK